MERALSFGEVAETYHRYRPAPPAVAVEWLLPHRVKRAVDVGAGTGALTRLLLGRAETVVAVEPDDRMRRVLTRSRGPLVVGALGQALPLVEGGADAVVASSAWHWMDGAGALDEVARVLRPGGVLGVVWNGPDRSVPWVGRLFGNRPEAEVAHRHHHHLALPPGAPFEAPDHHLVEWSVEVTPDELAGLVGTYSTMIVLPDDQRRALLASVRSQASALAGAGGTLRLPLRCRSSRSVRR